MGSRAASGPVPQWRQICFLIYLAEFVLLLLYLNDVGNKSLHFSEGLMGGMVQLCPRCSIPCWLLNSQLPIRIPRSGVLASGFLRRFRRGSDTATDWALGCLALTQWLSQGFLGPARHAGMWVKTVALASDSPELEARLLCLVAVQSLGCHSAFLSV